MRTLTSMMLALVLGGVATTASAQATEPAAHTPVVTLELQGRFGGGHAWATASDAAGIPSIEGGDAGTGSFGATASLRHYGTGLGITGGYTSAFTGVETHYGTQAFDVRLSERFTFFRRAHVALSLLAEVGYVHVEGGAHYECPHNWLSISSSPPNACTDRDVSVSGDGGLGAIGFQVQSGAFLGGLEVDYRRLDGGGALAVQDDVMVLARIGVGIDL